MEGAKWKSTVLEISMNWWQLEFHPTEFQFYRINSGYGVVRTLQMACSRVWLQGRSVLSFLTFWVIL